MIEELLIRIRAIMSGDGFAKAETSLRKFQSVNKQALGEAAIHNQNFNNQINKSGGLIDNVKNKMGQLGITTRQLAMGMMAAGAGIVAAWAMIAYMGVQAAADSEKGWLQLTSQLGRSGEEFRQVQAEWSGTINAISDASGRTKGVIKDMTNTLVSFGLTSQEALRKAEPLITGRAFQVGTEVESATQAYGQLVSGIGRPMGALKQLKITWEDLGTTQEAWKNMTKEQRQALLDQALAAKGAAEANEAYKMTFAGMIEQLTGIGKSILVEIGEAILPTLLDVTKAAVPVIKDIVNAFKDLPGPVKTIIIFLPLVIGFLMIIGGAWMLISPLIGTLSGVATALFGVELAASSLMAVLVPLALLAILITVTYVETNKEVREAIQEMEQKYGPNWNKGGESWNPGGHMPEFYQSSGQHAKENPFLPFGMIAGSMVEWLGYHPQVMEATHKGGPFGMLTSLRDTAGVDIGKLLSERIQGFAWPTIGDITNILSSTFGIKIPVTQFPTIGEYLQLINNILGIKIPDMDFPGSGDIMGSIGNLLNIRIDSLVWPSLGEIGGWIQKAVTDAAWGKITGTGSLSGGNQGFDTFTKLIGTGPGGVDLGSFYKSVAADLPGGITATIPNPMGGGNVTIKKEIHLNNPIFDSKKTADYFAGQVAKHLGSDNDKYGR